MTGRDEMHLHIRRTIMKPLSELCCINPDCSEHGQRGGENLRVRHIYGKSDTVRL